MYTFLKDESGAVSTDWTVLTAALVGLGLASASMVRGGVSSTTDEIDETLRGMSVFRAFDTIYSSTDFTNGDRGDWIGGVVTEIPGFGEVLALSSQSNMAALPIDIGDDHPYAQVEFDLIFGDSWDGEQGEVSLNGTTLLVGTHAWREGEPDIRIVEGPNNTNIQLTRTSVDSGAQGSSGWRANNTDYTYRVQVTAENGSDLVLEAATTLNQGTHDEFLGIDNVDVGGVNQQ
ncbi:MAG: hypothetical protein AAF366_21570 [Pseudomonadota bacterium]